MAGPVEVVLLCSRNLGTRDMLLARRVRRALDSIRHGATRPLPDAHYRRQSRLREPVSGKAECDVGQQEEGGEG